MTKLITTIKLRRTPLSAAIIFAMAVSTPVHVAAQEAASMADDTEIEEVVSLGTRSAKPRTAMDSTVPIDVISGEDFSALGNAADVTDNLKAFVPSYTATPATGDGSAFVRPTSLRGLAPDQTLVLVNGKRRHRSALVHFFAPAAGNGAHGPDIGMIPSIALKRVEVLRDGASSQYGSDAIAGVMNFVLKDASEGGEFIVQYGQFYEGEISTKIAGNMGMELGESGFLNFSLEIVDNEALSRGLQRPNAQALIDAGVQGVGADSPFGDAPFVQSWGRPASGAARFFVNAGVDLTDSLELYFHGNYAKTDGRYRFFYRNPNHSSIATLRALGFQGLQAGYTPFLDGDQQDFSLVGGIKGEMDNGWLYDFSVALGSNSLDYFLNNTLNPSLGLVGGQPAQRNFDVGGYQQTETNLNADFSKALSDSLNLAVGFEWREEVYEAKAGEPNSYFGSGSNGFGGIKPQDAGEFDRDNYALYVEVEKDVSDELLVQAALRYEDFSDFGSTVNGKLAGRFSVSDTFTLRSSVSTGFHAPTPGQSNVQTTITTFDGTTGLQVEEGLVPATSAAALAVGGAPLTEEKSLNYSIGMTTDLSDRATLTLDFYQIEIDDRIYRTGDIAVPGSTTGATISFYTNALDIKSSGIDLVFTTDLDWSDSTSTDLTLALNYSKIEVTGQTLVGGIQPVSDSTVEDIENNYPSLRFVLSTNTHFGDDWNLMLRANFYGSHYDERGTINSATSPSAKIDPVVYFDLELGKQVTDSLKLVFGGSNIFDSFVDEIGPPNANRLSVGLQYPRRSAANYEGGSWYLQARYSF